MRPSRLLPSNSLPQARQFQLALNTFRRCYGRRRPNPLSENESATEAAKNSALPSSKGQPKQGPSRENKDVGKRAQQYAPHYQALMEIAQDPSAFKDLGSLLAAMEGNDSKLKAPPALSKDFSNREQATARIVKPKGTKAAEYVSLEEDPQLSIGKVVYKGEGESPRDNPHPDDMFGHDNLLGMSGQEFEHLMNVLTEPVPGYTKGKELLEHMMEESKYAPRRLSRRERLQERLDSLKEAKQRVATADDDSDRIHPEVEAFQRQMQNAFTFTPNSMLQDVMSNVAGGEIASNVTDVMTGSEWEDSDDEQSAFMASQAGDGEDIEKDERVELEFDTSDDDDNDDPDVWDDDGEESGFDTSDDDESDEEYRNRNHSVKASGQSTQVGRSQGITNATQGSHNPQKTGKATYATYRYQERPTKRRGTRRYEDESDGGDPYDSSEDDRRERNKGRTDSKQRPMTLTPDINLSDKKSIAMAVKRYKKGKFPDLELMLAGTGIAAYGNLDEKTKKVLAQYYRSQLETDKPAKVMKGKEFSLGNSNRVTLEGGFEPMDSNRRMTRLGRKIHRAVQDILMRQEKTNPVLGGLGAEITRVEMSMDGRKANVYWRNNGPYYDQDVARALAEEEKQLRWEVQGRLDMKRAPQVVFQPDSKHNAQTRVDALLKHIGAEDEILS